MVRKFSLLGVQVSALNLELAFQIIDQMVQQRQKGYISVAPVSTVMACQDNPDCLNVINQATLVTPDGMPIVWLGRWMGYKETRRTYGPDLMRLVCDRGRQNGCRHFLLGGEEYVSERLEDELKRDYPGIIIAGRYCPPFDNGVDDQRESVKRINEAGPDIVWVGLGSPKQDFWMAKNRDKIHAPVLVGVGAAFDFIAGTKPQAPLWMRRSGLEWLFRLGCEPGRLWRRYLVGNLRFIYLVFLSWMRGDIKRYG